MSVITEIVRNVVALALIFSCLELFLPQGELSRFVRLACGLIMLALIIVPITDALQNLSWKNPFNNDGAVYADYDEATEQITMILEAEAMNEYEREASRQVEGLAILAEGITAAEAAVEVNAENGEIERVEITALKKAGADTATAENKIKELLGGYLNIEPEKIYLQIREESFWNKFSNLSKKEKSLFIKLAICLVAGIILMSLGSSNNDSTSTPNDSSSLQEPAEPTASTSYYSEEKELEDKLISILSEIKGAGAVTVALTFEQGTEYVYAEENNEKQSADQSETSTSLAQINDSPVLVKQRLPEVKGVVIVAEGAGDALVKERLYQAIKSLLGLTSSQIAIIEGNTREGNTSNQTIENNKGGAQ